MLLQPTLAPKRPSFSSAATQISSVEWRVAIPSSVPKLSALVLSGFVKFFFFFLLTRRKQKGLKTQGV